MLSKEICSKCINEKYPKYPFGTYTFVCGDEEVTESELFEMGYVYCIKQVYGSPINYIDEDGNHVSCFVTPTVKIPDKCLYYLEHVLSEEDQ